MKTARNTTAQTATATVTINAALCAASAACIRVGVAGTRREVYLPLEEIVAVFGGIPSSVTMQITATDDAIILPTQAHAAMLARTADLKAAGDRAAALNAGQEVLAEYGLTPPARFTPKPTPAPVAAPQTVTRPRSVPAPTQVAPIEAAPATRSRRITAAPTPAPMQVAAETPPTVDPRVDALEQGMHTLTAQLAALTAALTGQATPEAPTKGRVRK